MIDYDAHITDSRYSEGFHRERCPCCGESFQIRYTSEHGDKWDNESDAEEYEKHMSACPGTMKQTPKRED